MGKLVSERVHISESKGEVVISISGKIEKWKETLLFAWVVGWTFCGLAVVYQFFGDFTRDVKLWLVVYLACWIYFEYKMVYAYLWRKWGIQYLRIDCESLVVKNDIRGFGGIDSYFIENIEQLAPVDEDQFSFASVIGNSFWIVHNPSIMFSHLGRNVGVASQLSPKEVKDVLKTMDYWIRKKG